MKGAFPLWILSTSTRQLLITAMILSASTDPRDNYGQPLLLKCTFKRMLRVRITSTISIDPPTEKVANWRKSTYIPEPLTLVLEFQWWLLKVSFDMPIYASSWTTFRTSFFWSKLSELNWRYQPNTHGPQVLWSWNSCLRMATNILR